MLLELVVRAIKRGAEQFLIKPIELPSLFTLLTRAMDNKRHRQQTLIRQSKARREQLDPFVGESKEIRYLRHLATRLVTTVSPILIQGETGTGKGVLAKWIHDNSDRSEAGFIRLGDVRDRTVDIRLISATHRNLKELVRRQRFREDLHFRINIIPVRIPPLRERPEDIPKLANDILLRIVSEKGWGEIRLDDSAIELLGAYPWPGNIREMHNVLERAAQIAQHSPLTAKDLELQYPGDGSSIPTSSRPETMDTNLTIRQMESRYIALVLAEEKARSNEQPRDWVFRGAHTIAKSR